MNTSSTRLTSESLKGLSKYSLNQQRICSHPRLYGRPGQYHTVQTHMPEKHKQYVQWNTERFLSWAQSVGPYTTTVIHAILSSHRVEQQGYKACMGILKLADKYSLIRLEAACERALSYTPSPSYKNISTILKTGQDTLPAPAQTTAEPDAERPENKHSFTRGADYYGRNSSC